jgi:hypothetical protein
MTDDQFKQLLQENNADLLEQFDERLDARLEENNNRLIERVDKRLDARLEQNNAALFGKLSRQFDTQFEELRADLATRTDRIYTQLDGLTKRLADDEAERAAISAEQDRHHQWIDQLAKASSTKLVPEQ